MKYHLTRRRWIQVAAALGAIGSTIPVVAQAPATSTLDKSNLPYRPIRATGPGGVSIAIQDWGNPSGREIVLIHGVLQSHLSFEKQVLGDLSREFRLVTYDLRGHGDSDKPIGDGAYRDGSLWADDLKAVMSAVGLKKPVLVAWSLGALPVATYLAKYGDRDLAGINFVDALTKRSAEFAGRPENRTHLAMAASPDLATRVGGLRAFLRACFERPPSETDFERMLAFNAQVPHHVLASILAGVSLNADEAYRAVKVPILITHGEQDGVLSPKIVEFGLSVMSHARTSLYAGIGHAPFYEDPERFNRELADFVRSAPG